MCMIHLCENRMNNENDENQMENGNVKIKFFVIKKK